jgi:hypothetical protein
MTENQSNVRQITEKQPAPAARFTITALVDGFPVSIEAEGKAGDLRALVAKLREIGAEPPSVQTPAQPAAAAKTASAPRCPVHNSPMKEGRRGFFCPKKVGDGYCKETA